MKDFKILRFEREERLREELELELELEREREEREEREELERELYERYEQCDDGECDTCPKCGGVYFYNFASPSSIEGELCCDSCISRGYDAEGYDG